MCEDEVPGWALKSKSTNYPDHGDLPLLGKIPMVEPGIEPRTSWLVVRNLDHETTRLVSTIKIKCKKFYNLLRQKNTYVKNAPTKEEIEKFWKEIFGKNVQHNDKAYWIKNQC